MKSAETLPRPHRWPVLVWLVGVGLSGAAAGLAAAAFLWLLDLATHFRLGHTTIVFALPLCGLGLGALWQRFGESIRRGNDLVIDTIRRGGPRLPRRMAPMVLLGSVATHLFGGSAGREGAAVQMGASLADLVAQHLGAESKLRHQLVMAGAAGGFGAVFGTPLAGSIFALELSGPGRRELRAWLPSLLAALVGDLTTRGLGIHHTPYPQLLPLSFSPALVAQWLVFSGVVAAVAVVFIELLQLLKKHGTRLLPSPPLRAFFGGLVVVLLWRLAGTSDYLGLGVPMILRAFEDAELPASALPWKVIFTCVTLAAGFLGGEVTPLFFIGAVLGNLLARALALPLELGAAVGLAALFGAAANAPLALSVMAVELFGVAVLPHVVLVCLVARWLTGSRSIYRALLQS
jgi:H+/Cl- antiporter ClcA